MRISGSVYHAKLCIRTTKAPALTEWKIPAIGPSERNAGITYTAENVISVLSKQNGNAGPVER